MKKYITIAALLAAGTAFANAEELKDGKLHTSDYITEDGSFSVALNLDVERLRVYLEAGQAKAWGTSIIEYNCNGVQTGVVYNGSSNSAQKITASGLYAKWGTNNVWNSVRWDGDTDLATLEWDDVTAAGLVYTHDTSSGTYVSFALLRENGTSLVNSFVQAATLKSSDATAALVTLGDVVDYAWHFETALTTETEMKDLSVTVATAVPEPSAFGLLAGMGALALVASRRRRK